MDCVLASEVMKWNLSLTTGEGAARQSNWKKSEVMKPDNLGDTGQRTGSSYEELTQM